MAESQIAHAPTVAASLSGPAPAAGERLPEGTKVGDYVVEHFLGAGAMGEVYSGRHPVIGKRVAIKILKRELADKEGEAEARFVREARAVNVVDHANVIDVFNFGRLDDGRLYLMMDLVDGKSLRHVLQDGQLPVEKALDILGQIADALDAAHKKGVIHRDLKPDNVMLTTESKVKVLDFGIAKLVSTSATGNGTLTEKGSWLGTPGYMAPEQWSADGAGPASDRYALGVMAFEMLSGTLPFQAPTLPQMMEQHFRAPVPALSTKKGTTGKPPEHHQTLDPVLARAMAKNPDARFATGRQLVDALRTAAKGTAVEASAGAKRSLAMPAAAGAAVLGLAVVGFIVIRGDKTTQDDNTRDERAERPAGSPRADGDFVKLTVISMPDKARVLRDGQLVGQTPITVDVRGGTETKLVIGKPGYRAETQLVTPSKDQIVRKDLQILTGFEGVWTMPDGKLRGFWRQVDSQRIEVFTLETANGERTLWRTCDLVDPPDGVDPSTVVFIASVPMTHESGTDATCSVPTRVEYRYDPAREQLEVRAENVDTAKQPDGKCIVLGRDPGQPMLLARAERTDRRTLTPPVASKVKLPPPPVLDKKLVELKKLEDAKKNAANAKKGGNDSFDNVGDVPQKGGNDSFDNPRPAPKQVPPTPKQPDKKEPALDPPPQQDGVPNAPPNAPNKAPAPKIQPQQQQKSKAPPPVQKKGGGGDSQQATGGQKD